MVLRYPIKQVIDCELGIDIEILIDLALDLIVFYLCLEPSMERTNRLSTSQSTAGHKL